MITRDSGYEERSVYYFWVSSPDRADRLENIIGDEIRGQAMTSDIQQGIPITTEALKDIRVIGDMHLSADGKRIAFEVQECPPGQTKGRTRIWMVETPDSKAEPLTHGKKDDLCPRWSPDGTQLAFISTGEGEKDKPQLHLIAATGGDVREVCTLPNGVSALAWSPDGSKIAFLALMGTETDDDPRVFPPFDGVINASGLFASMKISLKR